MSAPQPPSGAARSGVRLDKYLWACRFYRTRSLARAMIEGGKVDYNGQRAKPSRSVEVGARIRLLVGGERREVEVLALSEVRGPYAEAQLLYAETPESAAQRARQRELVREEGHPRHGDLRPSKKQRRDLLRLMEQGLP